MNVQAWRHHFPIINPYGMFRRPRAPNSEESGPIWPKFELVRDFMPVLVKCKFDEYRIKTEGVSMEKSFRPIISQWALSVTMEIRRTADHWYTVSSHSESSAQVN